MSIKSILVAIASLAILGFTGCTKAPMACVDSTSKTGTVGQAVSFDASCSTNVHHYEWSFGDGGTGADAKTTHIYTTAGTYTAKVKVFSMNMKKESEKSITVTIN